MSIWTKLGFGSAAETISPDEAHKGRMEGNVVIVDVRDADEWQQTGSPQGSIRISLGDAELDRVVKEHIAERSDVTVALSCKTGIRSNSAAKRLSKAGISNLRIVDGGVHRWISAGLPVDK